MEFTVEYLRNFIHEIPYKGEYRIWFKREDQYRADVKKVNYLIAFIPDICDKNHAEESSIEFRLERMYVADNSVNPIYVIDGIYVDYDSIDDMYISMCESVFDDLDDALNTLCKKVNAMQIVTGDEYLITNLQEGF